jgi:hypothetical protein
MSENKKKRSFITVNKEVAAELKKYCQEKGLKIQFAADRAVSEWLEKQKSKE